MPPAGIHAVTVPGAVDGWAQLHKHYGNLPWDRLFASAIAYAERNGIPYQVFESKPPVRQRISYADNFAFPRREAWTH